MNTGSPPIRIYLHCFVGISSPAEPESTVHRIRDLRPGGAASGPDSIGNSTCHGHACMHALEPAGWKLRMRN